MWWSSIFCCVIFSILWYFNRQSQNWSHWCTLYA